MISYTYAYSHSCGHHCRVNDNENYPRGGVGVGDDKCPAVLAKMEASCILGRVRVPILEQNRGKALTVAGSN